MIKMFTKKRRKGFTLIELIVVIAILGILAAIAIPRFSDVQTNAKLRANQATARTIASAVTMAEATVGKALTSSNVSDIKKFLDGIEIEIVTTAPTGTTHTKWQIILGNPLAIYAPGSSAKIDLNAAS